MVFNDKVYDCLKWIAQYLLPACGTLYFSLASLWGLPYAEQVVGTITAVDALLGVLLGISTASYKGDGTLVINKGTENMEESDVSIEVPIPLADMAKKNSVMLKVETIDG